MTRVLVTGGAGFIGRWVVKALLAEGYETVVLDDFSNGNTSNLAEFQNETRLTVLENTVADEAAVMGAFAGGIDACLHLAAKINVQHSIDNPRDSYLPDVQGTLNVLEEARRVGARVVFMSTCMVYERAYGHALREDDPVRPASPYAASKLSGEQLVISFGLAYSLPVCVLRPFNTYGPFQRADGEGGVVWIFCKRADEGEAIEVFGDGTQTRDLLYVEDCAELVLRAAFSDAVQGEIVNGGTGVDVEIRALAELIGGRTVRVVQSPHPHPQAEIAKLVCDASKAERLLHWKATTPLTDGVQRTQAWIAENAARSRGAEAKHSG